MSAPYTCSEIATPSPWLRTRWMSPGGAKPLKASWIIAMMSPRRSLAVQRQMLNAAGAVML